MASALIVKTALGLITTSPGALTEATKVQLVDIVQVSLVGGVQSPELLSIVAISLSPA